MVHENDCSAVWRGMQRLAAVNPRTTMIRAIAFATMLGALVASVAVHPIGQPGRRNVIAPLFGGFDRGAETAIMPESWPICTTMASVASDADWAQPDPDFKAGKKALGAEDWNGCNRSARTRRAARPA